MRSGIRNLGWKKSEITIPDPQHCFLRQTLSLLPDQSTAAAHKARVRLGEGKDDLVPAGVGGGAVVGGGAATATAPPRGHPTLPAATRVRIVRLLQGRPERESQYIADVDEISQVWIYRGFF